MNKPFLAGCSAEALTAWCETRKFPKFRVKQLCNWLYTQVEINPDAMLNLPGSMREALKEDFYAPGSSVSEIVSSTDGVEKLLLKLHDGECIEMVVIPADDRLTFCLSTQVGCPVGCYFCASGKNGFTRNLRAGEIIEEFMLGVKRAGFPDNLVFMGIGEGLLNFEELSSALETLTSPDGFGMSPRRITVSTSGYVPGMLKFAQLKREFNLAVSLHAVTDEIRARLIPSNVRYSIAEILKAADLCRDANNRQYTIEYTMISGINDDLDSARKLADIALTHHAKINLIPYNATDGMFRRPERSVIEAFETEIKNAGARVTRRVERGTKESAACGQLRISRSKNQTSGK